MPNPLGRLPTWLIPAWNLGASRVPRDLQVDCPITLHEDVGQGGWGTGQWLFSNVAQGTNSAAAVVAVVNKDANSTVLVREVQVIHQGGTASGTVSGELIPPQVDPTGPAALQAGIVVWRGVIGVDSLVSIPDLRPYPVVVPPGWAYRVDFPATGAGENYGAHHCLLNVGAGYKPV